MLLVRLITCRQARDVVLAQDHSVGLKPNPEALDISFRFPLRITWSPASLQEAVPKLFSRMGFEMKSCGQQGRLAWKRSP